MVIPVCNTATTTSGYVEGCNPIVGQKPDNCCDRIHSGGIAFGSDVGPDVDRYGERLNNNRRKFRRRR